jgi:hypothetical protein
VCFGFDGKDFFRPIKIRSAQKMPGKKLRQIFRPRKKKSAKSCGFFGTRTRRPIGTSSKTSETRFLSFGIGFVNFGLQVKTVVSTPLLKNGYVIRQQTVFNRPNRKIRKKRPAFWPNLYRPGAGPTVIVLY